LHVALDLRHTDADFLLQKLTDVTYAAASKVVDIVILGSWGDIEVVSALTHDLVSLLQEKTQTAALLI
jgi:hypothetical protein